MTSNKDSTSGHVSDEKMVMGSSRLFKGDVLQFIPMPTPDPKDPLNLSERRKWLAIAALCFFGSLAISIESVIGHLIPLFFLEYNNIDPKRASDLLALYKERHNGTAIHSTNALAALTTLENGTPLSRVILLSTLPLLVNGIASFFLVPLSVAIGRRPVLILAGLLAWIGGIGAGQSTSLTSHLAARCLQGFGAGAVDSLIPLIMCDLMFIHQRNKALATLNASHGVILVCLGVAGPYVALRLSWRYLYRILSCLTAVSWLSIIFCVPETRVNRSKDELAGKHVYHLHPGEARPRLDFVAYSPRTKWAHLCVLNTPPLWKLGFRSFLDTLRCFLSPTVLWAVLLTSIKAGVGGAKGQTATTILLAAGWKFEHLGLAGLPIMAATPFTWFVSGYLADRVCNHVAKRSGGRREPENSLLNIIVPIMLCILGVCVFGYAAAHIAHLSSAVILIAFFFFVFGSICTNTTMQVFLVESYPNLAGPVLVALSSLRLVVGFGFTVKATDWISAIGFMKVFGMYAGLIAFAALLGVLIWCYGKRIRVWTVGTVQADAEADGAGNAEHVQDEVQTSYSQPSNGSGGDMEKRKGVVLSEVSARD